MIIAQEKMSAFAYISIAEASLKLLIVILLMYFKTYDSLIVYSFLLLFIQLIIRFYINTIAIKILTCLHLHGISITGK